MMGVRMYVCMYACSGRKEQIVKSILVVVAVAGRVLTKTRIRGSLLVWIDKYQCWMLDTIDLQKVLMGVNGT